MEDGEPMETKVDLSKFNWERDIYKLSVRYDQHVSFFFEEQPKKSNVFTSLAKSGLSIIPTLCKNAGLRRRYDGKMELIFYLRRPYWGTA